MSEVWGQQDTAAFAGQPAANDTLSAGALLRRAREEAGIHVAALAVSLKVPVPKLEALEEDRWDVLPDAVFVRALASSICRTLKIDPQPVLERLPQTTAPRLIQSGEGINTPFHAPSDGAAPGWIEQLSRPVFLAVFALLLGALVLILLPIAQKGDPADTAAGSPAPAAPPSAPAAPGADPAVMTLSATRVEQPAPSAAAPSSFVPAAVAAASAAGPGARLAAPAPAVKQAANPAPAASATIEGAAAAATPASGIIVFRTKADSWIEVTDAKGDVAVRRLLLAGEAAGASGALPLQVVIGRVDATEVQVRGKPFDLRRVSRDNVARFQVK